MRLSDARWPAVAGADRGVLVLPLGATEQHGPHLPLDTDTFLATAIAERAVARRSGAALAPAIPVGASGEHADFPGTLSIGTAALALLVVEFCRHAQRDWPAVLIVNGHGGNAAALEQAARRSREEKRLLGVVHLGLPGMDGHAGRAETSMMLHLAPSRVQRRAIEAGETTPVAELMAELRSGGVRAVSPNGVLGDPRGATAAEGEGYVRSLEAKVLGAYDALVAAIPTGAASAAPPAIDD